MEEVSKELARRVDLVVVPLLLMRPREGTDLRRLRDAEPESAVSLPEDRRRRGLLVVLPPLQRQKLPLLVQTVLMGRVVVVEASPVAVVIHDIDLVFVNPEAELVFCIGQDSAAARAILLHPRRVTQQEGSRSRELPYVGRVYLCPSPARRGGRRRRRRRWRRCARRG